MIYSIECLFCTGVTVSDLQYRMPTCKGTGCAIFLGVLSQAENKFWGIFVDKITSSHKFWGVILEKWPLGHLF